MAKAITAGAECIPFPYVKGVFGTVVVILETVEVRHFLISEPLPHIGFTEIKEESRRRERAMRQYHGNHQDFPGPACRAW
jgi:hypothetical protein